MTQDQKPGTIVMECPPSPWCPAGFNLWYPERWATAGRIDLVTYAESAVRDHLAKLGVILDKKDFSALDFVQKDLLP